MGDRSGKGEPTRQNGSFGGRALVACSFENSGVEAFHVKSSRSSQGEKKFFFSATRIEGHMA